MQTIRTDAIVLRRTNYGEADRILNFLTPDHGKLGAIAKGVRRPKSKLAGGLELFATCEVTIILGKRDMGTVSSARLGTFYGNILKDYDRMQFGYECIKLTNRAAETVAEPDFYYLLRDSFVYLDNLTVNEQVTELWFRLRFATILGVGLNIATDVTGGALRADEHYTFDFDNMAFVLHGSGKFNANHIKLLRLASTKNPAVLGQVRGVDKVLGDCLWLVRALH